MGLFYYSNVNTRISGLFQCLLLWLMPWLCESVVLIEIECSHGVMKGSLGATRLLCFYTRLTRMPGGVCLDLLERVTGDD